MRKIFINVLFFIIALLVVFSLLKSLGYNKYSRIAKVDKIENGVVTFKDENGNLWEWELKKNESYKLDDDVILIMDDNGTEYDITDDKILKIKF